MEVPLNEPKILFFDIETCGVNALKSDLGFVVCFGYKWKGDAEARCLTARRKDLRTLSDKWILKKASKIMSEADLLVGHYACIFDRRFLQGRLLINGMKPIPATKMRDTCMIARSVANYSSNRLGHLAKILKLDQRKQDKGDGWPAWWLSVLAGDMGALKKMALYCRQDVQTLEALYKKLLPFDNAHPRMVHDRTLCAICGGVVEYRGFSYVGQLRYRRYRCTRDGCRKWDRERRAA